jgi:hypothetical protein
MVEIWYTATQPLFFPRIHMLERFARCHRVVILQEAQWQRHGGHTRTMLAGGSGPFSAPLQVKNKGQRPLDQLEVLPGWSGPFIRTLEGTYGRCPGWPPVGPSLLRLLAGLDGDGITVADVGEVLIRWLGSLLGLSCQVIRSKDLVPERPREPTAWMASFARPLGATDYLQGARAIAAYFVPGVFSAAGCRVWGQTFKHHYHPDGATALDPLFRRGLPFLRDLILGNLGRGAAVGTAVRMAAYE